MQTASLSKHACHSEKMRTPETVQRSTLVSVFFPGWLECTQEKVFYGWSVAQMTSVVTSLTMDTIAALATLYQQPRLVKGALSRCWKS